jgi:hypothetical protein
MDTEETPLVELDADGTPAVLNYNVPEPTSYTGRNLIRLEYDTGIFKELIGEEALPDVETSDPDFLDGIADWMYERSVLGPGSPSITDVVLTTGDDEDDGGDTGGTGGSGGGTDDWAPPKDLAEPPLTRSAARARTSSRALDVARSKSPAASSSAPSTKASAAGKPKAGAGTVAAPSAAPASVSAGAKSLKITTTRARNLEATSVQIDEKQTIAAANTGQYPYLVKTATGDTKVVYADVGEIPDPGIYLVETYRLSNFLGDYGAGRTVGTFSLLPGEKTKISIKTWKSTTATDTSTSSIFDSYTTTAEDTFESSLQSENSDTESKDKTTEWNVEAEASGNWGVAKASVSGGASGSTNTSREEFSKNVSSATEKHAQTASAQRDVTVNSTTTTTYETSEETAIEREISNINVSRALNFVFRQLNQEHVSILHLVDVRVAFFNGYIDTKMEVPLHEIDRLLEYCVTKPSDRATIKADILYLLRNVYDYRNEPQSALVTPARQFTERDGTTTTLEVFDRSKTSTYDPDGRNITVDGIILSTRTVVLRTDAVIVEALLGQANALDDYSIGLQDERVREKQLANDAASLSLEERKARLGIVASKDETAAMVWSTIFTEGLVEADGDSSAEGES